MKSSKVMSWVVVLSVCAGALGACGGVSSIGKGDDDGKGGTDTSIGGSGKGGSSATGAAPSKGGGASMGASSSTGGSGSAPGAECADNGDCPQSGEACEKCADGSVACQQVPCIDGKCTPIQATCNDECSSDMDCPVPDIACAPCDGGGNNCPVASCVKGNCQVTFPTCGTETFCKDKACGASCTATCADGKCDPMSPAFCNGSGSCVVGFPECSTGEMCNAPKDCPAAPPNCIACDASGSVCAGFDCIKGLCVFTCPAVPTPICKFSEECPVRDDCQMCPSGKCAVPACLQGSCQQVCPL